MPGHVGAPTHGNTDVYDSFVKKGIDPIAEFDTQFGVSVSLTRRLNLVSFLINAFGLFGLDRTKMRENIEKRDALLLNTSLL